MSQAHIPQPTAESAPAEVFESTQAAPHTTTISGIGNPGPSPAEVTRHTLAHNNIDSYFYEQFVFLDKFTWTTNNVGGTMLFSMPIHPKAFYRELAYLSALYNTWGGGIEVNFKIAGTGFHAGALAFARIPPNYNPVDLGANYGFTRFEYKVMDAKTLEVDTVHVGDQRQVVYHYTDAENNSPKSWDIGGHLACYVWAGLNTAATSTQSIQVIMSMRLAPEFKFSQLRPLSIENEISDQIIPPAFEAALAFRFEEHRMTPDRFGEVSTLKILPQTVKRLANPFYPSVDEIGNSRKARNGDYQYFPVRQDGVAFQFLSGDLLQFRKSAQLPIGAGGMYSIAQYESLFLTDIETISSSKSQYKGPIQDIKYETASTFFQLRSDGALPSNWSPNDKVAGFYSSGSSLVTFRDQSKDSADIITSGSTPTPSLNESFVVFGGLETFIAGFVQTYSMALAMFTTSMSSWLAAGEAALFAVVDTDDDVPLFYVKFYREGYFTARPPAAQTSYKLNKLKLVYQSKIRTTTEIPSSGPGMSKTNRVLYASLHKRALRELQRSQTTKAQ